MLVNEHTEAAVRPRDAAQLLRTAADALRRAGRPEPRGPWRWGDPDVGDQPDSGPVPRHELWPAPPDRWPSPLDEPARMHLRDPFGPSPSEAPAVHPGVRSPTSRPLDPDVAESLAALLDVLAEHIERDDEAVDPQTRLTATHLARSLIRSYAALMTLTEEDVSG
jgi:hypothetical protein